MRDTLFLLAPGFADHGQIWFCPYSAQVMGMLTYYPALRATVDVIELPFPRPRQPLIDLLGEAHQAPPMLVLGAGAPDEVPGVAIGASGGRRFVSKTLEILRYLAATRGLPAPH